MGTSVMSSSNKVTDTANPIVVYCPVHKKMLISVRG